MELEYYAIVTEIGTASIANAAVYGEQVALTQFAVGDGGGSYYRPTKEMTELKGEKWRGEINNYEVDSSNANLITVRAMIPAAIGGFVVREMGVFDDKGQLIAISNTPDSVKITTDSGAVKEMEVEIEILVSNTDVVKIQVNPTVAIATKKDIKEHNESVNAHKEEFGKKANVNLNNVSREVLLEKIGNVTEAVEELIGLTNDTDGTTQYGTIMAKLNKLLTNWTTTRAGYIDTIHTNAARLTSTRATKIDNIGATGDTGGTTTAGTVMGKLNALLNTIVSGSMGIKSVQHGFASTIDNGNVRVASRDITITSVNTNKSILITDSGIVSNYTVRTIAPAPYLAGSTTIRQNNGSSTSNMFPGFNWSIVEFI